MVVHTCRERRERRGGERKKGGGEKEGGERERRGKEAVDRAQGALVVPGEADRVKVGAQAVGISDPDPRLTQLALKSIPG